MHPLSSLVGLRQEMKEGGKCFGARSCCERGFNPGFDEEEEVWRIFNWKYPGYIVWSITQRAPEKISTWNFDLSLREVAWFRTWYKATGARIQKERSGIEVERAQNRKVDSNTAIWKIKKWKCGNQRNTEETLKILLAIGRNLKRSQNSWTADRKTPLWGHNGHPVVVYADHNLRRS